MSDASRAVTAAMRELSAKIARNFAVTGKV
jgi:hypothetical protein